MIYLSQSSIYDFLICSQRYKFRIFDAESAEKTLGDTAQNIGSAVHNIVELYWQHRDNIAVKTIEKTYKITEASSLKSIDICLNNFYTTISPLLSGRDLIEFPFKVRFNKDAFIVGRMDRVTDDGILFDWKTSYNVPDSIDKNLQFILYYWAYKKMFKKEPKDIFLVSLSKNKLLKFNLNKQYYDELIENIIPAIIKEIQAGLFYKEGIYKGACEHCAFNKICLEEGRT